MKKNQIVLIFAITITMLFIISFFVINLINNKTQPEKVVLKELPKPEITGGTRGELGIDKNINEQTIDEYLKRPDSVYRDMRMLIDPGNYEAIGGDRYLSGYIEGFEVIPLPYIIPITGLPSEVGDTYIGTTLFHEENGTYIANYEESMKIIEEIFPKDKVIFLMCGGGGYAGMTKKFLVSMGWDENKIYNTGGYWYYKGKHNIEVKKEIDNIVKYDFDIVPYHDINFSKLTKSSNYKDPVIKVSELKISTTNLELEEGTSFKLNVIVLPNNASNKEVEWTSSDDTIATVNNEGLVEAHKKGTAIITTQSKDSNKSVTCVVTVSKKGIAPPIKIDDVSKEAEEMNSYDLNIIERNFTELTTDIKTGLIKDEYAIILEDGGRKVNDLWREEFKKYQKAFDEANTNRIRIMNKLVDEQKTFIIIVYNKECESRPYVIAKEAERILKGNNYSYITVGSPPLDGDKALEESKIDISKYKGGSIVIIKKGALYASIDPDVDTIKNEKELKNWLNKYIEIK